MSWVGPAIGAAGSLLGGLFGSSGAKKASQAELQAAREAMELQRQQYSNAMVLNEPWRVTGQGALSNLAQLYGLPYQNYTPLSALDGTLTPGRSSPMYQPVPGMNTAAAHPRVNRTDGYVTGVTGGEPDLITRITTAIRGGASPDQIRQQYGAINTPAGPNMGVFTASPDYQFRRDEGMRGIQQSAVARTGGLGGNALRDLVGFNSNLAAGEFSNYFERMSRLAGFGGAATNNAINVGQNYAANAGNAAMAGGSARASGVMGAANSWGNAIQGVANAASDYFTRPPNSGLVHNPAAGLPNISNWYGWRW